MADSDNPSNEEIKMRLEVYKSLLASPRDCRRDPSKTYWHDAVQTTHQIMNYKI